jgi:3-hydroxyacyl-CoA dehydrogenase
VIRRAAVLGAGTMGAQIAAHLANAGVPALLLDLTADVARQGLERARKLRPDPFFTPDAARLIDAGGFDTDFDRIRDCDWIVEAVVERLDAKRSLVERIDAVRAAASIVSSNTSGIPLATIAEGRSASFRAHWVGTHFFNPPRYLRLVEVIPTGDTDPAVLRDISAFVGTRLGKGVVVAKDTPNFIANHLGLYGVIRILETLNRYTIEEIDAMTGPAIGRPKSATFRTMDIAGIDVLAHVARNLSETALTEEGRRAFTLPPLVDDMVAKGWIGDKGGQGFYKKQGAEILTLDPGSMSYRPKQPAKVSAIEAAKRIEDAGERIRTLFLGKDRVGEFMRETLGATLVYAARVTPDIAHSIDDVDRAMRWGFGWERGPFELWDAIGVQAVLDACGIADPPPLVKDLIARGEPSFRRGPLPPAAPDLNLLQAAKTRPAISGGRPATVKKNAGASLVDLGDGVLAVEFHSKMNAIGGDTIQMLHAGLKEATQNFAALVVGNDAPNFSVGANIMLLLLEAQEGNWDEVDLMIRTFQKATMALLYAGVPVVVAPAGMTLGGGCEISLHADRVQAAAETYMGLVEVGVGLIPGGGGTKELVARAGEGVALGPSVDLLPRAQQIFETIGFGKVSTSAADAMRLGLLRPGVDAITMNRERLLADAKARALARVAEGYQPRTPRKAIAVGGAPVLAALKLGVHLAWRAGRISDHDALVGRKLANIIAGGALPNPALVDEPYLLDLEREAFLSLCAERKTQERMAYTLKTGKPLRN